MFWGGWYGVVRVIVISIFAYGGLVMMLRVSGKRTLAKMNAFDWVVSVALGSTLASMILSKDVPLVEGLVAFMMLIGLQFIIAWLSVRSQTVRELVKSEPSLMLYNGTFLASVMRRERVTEGEVRSAIRAHGYANIADVGAVVMETNGSFTVLAALEQGEYSSLSNVPHYPPAPSSDA